MLAISPFLRLCKFEHFDVAAFLLNRRIITTSFDYFDLLQVLLNLNGLSITPTSFDYLDWRKKST